jgi:hypothetical protein
VAEALDPPASNAAFYREHARPGSVILIGGANVLHFRLRVAQSHLRHDLLPSFWSLAGLVVSKTAFLSVPVGSPLNPDTVPERNAIDECAMADFDDPVRFPNVAVISFADRADPIVANARRLQFQRGAIDLPTLLVPWLAFVWGAGTSGNPLFQNIGMPASAMIETAFGMSGIELTPGIAAAGSCPEAIWQSAIWWHEYYEKTATATASITGEYSKRADDVAAKAPEGRYVTRQPAAAVIERDSAPKKPLTRRSGPARRRQR